MPDRSNFSSENWSSLTPSSGSFGGGREGGGGGGPRRSYCDGGGGYEGGGWYELWELLEGGGGKLYCWYASGPRGDTYTQHTDRREEQRDGSAGCEQCGLCD